MKRVTFGVHLPNFCDQPYLRDRDITKVVDDNFTIEQAREIFAYELRGWVRPEELRFVKFLEVEEIK